MNGRLVWRALLAGTGFNIAVSLLMSFGSTAVFNMVDRAQFALLSFALRIVSALADIGGGAIAGYIARDDGPIHGALTSLIATPAVPPVSSPVCPNMLMPSATNKVPVSRACTSS